MNERMETPVEFRGSGCAECGSPVMAARNPFYGIDLATHKYVRNCVDCFWYEFAGDSDWGGRNSGTSKRGDRQRSFWARLKAAITILKAA